jgi:polyribonucleotide nucleotidyltransferase
MLGALMFAHRGMQPVIQAIIELAEHAAKEPFELPARDMQAPIPAASAIWSGADLRAAYAIKTKLDRRNGIAAAKERALAELGRSETNPDGMDPAKFGAAFKEAEAEVLRRDIIENGRRIDGRSLDKVRDIVSEVGVLPARHGSALFTRGETQALCVATLGTGEDEQYIDALAGTYKEKFLLHYNFPPFSVGETGRMGSPAVVRSATASSPGARSGRCCRTRRTSPTPCGWSPRSWSPTAPRRWPPSAAPAWR